MTQLTLRRQNLSFGRRRCEILGSKQGNPHKPTRSLQHTLDTWLNLTGQTVYSRCLLQYFEFHWTGSPLASSADPRTG